MLRLEVLIVFVQSFFELWRLHMVLGRALLALILQI